MSTLVQKKRNDSVVLEQVIIVILLAVLAAAGLFGLYRYLVMEPVVTPVDMDIKRLTEAVDSNPSDKNARLLLAYSFQRKGEFRKAVEGYNEVLKMNPNETGALYNLGIIAREQKDFGNAEKIFLKLLSVKKQHVLGCIALAELYLQEAKYDSAIKVLDPAIATQKTLVRPRLIKAKALEGKGDRAGAVAEYKEVLRYIPDQEEALAALQRLE